MPDSSLRMYFDDGSEPLTGSGIYTAPDGNMWFIEARDVVLACGGEVHEHDMRCYQPADSGPPLIPDAVRDGDWLREQHPENGDTK